MEHSADQLPSDWTDATDATLHSIFHDVSATIRDIVVTQLQNLHNTGIQLRSIREQLCALERELATAPVQQGDVPEPIVLPTQHVPVLSCSVSDPEVDEDSPACDSASDETPEASSNTTLPLAPPDDGSTVYDLLHGILQNDRGRARMWSMYASSQGLHQWDGVTTRCVRHFVSCATTQEALPTPCCEIVPPQRASWFQRLTGGWERFLTDVIGVTHTLYASVWNSVTPTYVSTCPEQEAFGGLPACLLSDTVSTEPCCMFIRADMCVQPAASVLATLDQALGSMRPFRIAIFLQRADSVAWNEWVSKWELRGRSALVWGAQSLRMRVYNLQAGSESWHEVDGPWELHVIDSGYQPVGHGISVMPCMLALRNFCRNKKRKPFYHPLPAFCPTHHPTASPCDNVPPCFDPAHVSAFWYEWNAIAARRASLLLQRKVDWDAVKLTMLESNRLLHRSPDRTLQRIARLSRLPHDWDLDEPDRLIYVMCGPHPPYVGQTGCITGPRSLLARYREHLRAARVLKNHFIGLRHRRVRGLMAFGKLPSLARVLAKHGPACMTMLGVQRVPPMVHGGQPERWWVRALSPTLNKRLPFGGLDQLRWSGILDASHTSVPVGERTLTALLQDITNSQGRGHHAHELLSLACEAVGHVGPELFDNFFTLVRNCVKKQLGFLLRRRYVVRIPTYDGHILRMVQSRVSPLLGATDMPPCIRAWYKRLVTVIAHPAPPVSQAVRSRQQPACVDCLFLHALRGSCVLSPCP